MIETAQYATGKRKYAVARAWVEPGSGDIQVNILEVVGARAAHLYGVHKASDTAAESKQHSICPGQSAWQNIMLVTAAVGKGFGCPVDRKTGTIRPHFERPFPLDY